MAWIQANWGSLASAVAALGICWVRYELTQLKLRLHDRCEEKRKECARMKAALVQLGVIDG